MTFPVCPCDGRPIAAPINLPELSVHLLSGRRPTSSFRQAVLTPLFTPATPMPLPVEQTLSVNGVPVWRTDGAGDLAVMIAEWFAYIADILTFYNERIANQDYLRTAILPESVNNLIALLGYRPRPAIGATGALAALVSPGPSFGGGRSCCRRGLQFQSKPTPGQPPQIFELSADTPIAAPDQCPATPPPVLLGEVHDGALALIRIPRQSVPVQRACHRSPSAERGRSRPAAAGRGEDQSIPARFYACGPRSVSPAAPGWRL